MVKAKRPNIIKRWFNRRGLFTSSDLVKAISAVKAADSRRTPVMLFESYGYGQIMDTPYNYSTLIKLSLGNEVLRSNHEAIIRESTRNNYDIKERFACKCKDCGTEYPVIKKKCISPECESTSFSYPDYKQKQIAEAFLKSPNRDDTVEQINESLLRYMLSTDDYWLSFEPTDIENLVPSRIYVEDSCYMRVVWDEAKGTIGNGEYFCPICVREFPTECYSKHEQCKRHPDAELKETAYVYAYGTEIRARFSHEEIYHNMAHPWLPSFYGNSLIVSGLRILMSIIAMDNFNFDNYSTGKLAQILVFMGLTQAEADDLALAVKHQKEMASVQERTIAQRISGDNPQEAAKLRTLFLGGKDGVTAVNAMPESEKMQSLDWWKLWREIFGSLYGVSPVFTGIMESGKTGNNPRMQFDVQNNTSEFYQHKVNDVYNSFVFPKLGVTDWVFEYNPLEEKDEAQDETIMSLKLANIEKAISLGMTAELTDEGEVKISGDPISYEEKQARQAEMFEKQAQTQPKEGDSGFKKESTFTTEKGKAWYVKEVNVNEESEHKHE